MSGEDAAPVDSQSAENQSEPERDWREEYEPPYPTDDIPF